MKNDVFLITKPIQYINVLNIENSNNKVLLIVDSFTDAFLFYKNVRKISTYWTKIYFFNNLVDVFKWLIYHRSKFKTLYIDSDINHKFEFFRLRKLNITVYEEGVGTYRDSQYKPQRKFLGSLFLFCLEIIGFKNRRGGSRFTKNIIVYFPIFYKNYLKECKKNILGFKKDFMSHVLEFNEIDLFNIELDFSIFCDKQVVLYLPSWEVNEYELKLLYDMESDFKIIKKHPHSKNFYNLHDFNFIITGNVPSELLIVKFLSVVSRLIIVSQFSSSTIYFSNLPNVEIVNTEVVTDVYDDIESYYRTYYSLVNYINSTRK